MPNYHQNNPGNYPPPPPYAYGPPPPYYNQPPYPNPYYNAPQRGPSLASRLCSLLCSLILIFLLILIIVWIIFRPKVPEFHLNSLTISNLNTTPTHISGNWTADITAYNPNTKLHAYYDPIEGYVYYKSEIIAQNRFKPFDLATKAETKFTATMIAAAAFADESVVVGLDTERKSGTLQFDLMLAIVVQFKDGAWTTRRRMLWVYCHHLTVGMSPKDPGSGALQGGLRKCFVHF